MATGKDDSSSSLMQMVEVIAIRPQDAGDLAVRHESWVPRTRRQHHMILVHQSLSSVAVGDWKTLDWLNEAHS